MNQDNWSPCGAEDARAADKDDDVEAARAVVRKAVIDLGSIRPGEIPDLLMDTFAGWSTRYCREIAAEVNVPLSTLYVRLIVCRTHSLLMQYDCATGMVVASAVSEIYPRSYPYRRTWEGETLDDYHDRRMAEEAI